MTTITVFNQKGGSGKSVVTVLLATCLSVDYGLRVVVVDADEQSTIKQFRSEAQRRIQHDPPFEVVKVAVKNVPDYIDDLRDSGKDQQIDILFIDIPGRIDDSFIIQTLTYCERILIPVVADKADRMATLGILKAMASLQQASDAEGYDLMVYAFNNKRSNTKEHRMLQPVFERTGLPFFNSSLGSRVAYKRVDTYTSFISETDQTITKDINLEVKAFCDEFLQTFKINNLNKTVEI